MRRPRFLVAALMLLASIVLLRSVSHGEPVPLRRAFSQFPMNFDGWRGHSEALDPAMVSALGVTDYLSRNYLSELGQQVDIYIGYYETQRTGETIHSPKNCLPGAGWEPVRAGRLTIPVSASANIVVNEYLVQKGLEQYLVLYWYQGHGRVIASEYSGKAWLVFDAITKNRTDEALVRIVTPARNGDAQAQTAVMRFAQDSYPLLNQFIPN